jgi:hypothetical protein
VANKTQAAKIFFRSLEDFSRGLPGCSPFLTSWVILALLVDRNNFDPVLLAWGVSLMSYLLCGTFWIEDGTGENLSPLCCAVNSNSCHLLHSFCSIIGSKFTLHLCSERKICMLELCVSSILAKCFEHAVNPSELWTDRLASNFSSEQSAKSDRPLYCLTKSLPTVSKTNLTTGTSRGSFKNLSRCHT